jgi:hypothetical protein
MVNLEQTCRSVDISLGGKHLPMESPGGLVLVFDSRRRGGSRSLRASGRKTGRQGRSHAMYIGGGVLTLIVIVVLLVLIF